jgi:hypothetical protein
VQQAKVLWSLAHLRLKVDEPTLERFKKIGSRLAIQRGGMTAKNRERLRPFDDAETVAASLGLPQRIRRVETKKRNAGLHFASIIAERRRALEHQRSSKKVSHLPSPSRPTANISPRISGRIKCHDACN